MSVVKDVSEKFSLYKTARDILEGLPEWAKNNKGGIGPYSYNDDGRRNTEKAICRSITNRDIALRMSRLFARNAELSHIFVCISNAHDMKGREAWVAQVRIDEFLSRDGLQGSFLGEVTSE